MNGRVRIVSDGVVQGTKVLMPDGTPLPNVMGIEILPLRAGGGAVQARVTLNMVELDVVAEQLPERVHPQEGGPELVSTAAPSRLYRAGETMEALRALQQAHGQAADA